MPYKDPEERRAYFRRYNAAIRPGAAESPTERRERTRQRRAAAREIIQTAKDQPCADCGLAWPYYVMQFDHVRGRKSFDVSKFSSQVRRNFALLHAEIAKCDVVCANCHAIRSRERRQPGRGDAPAPPPEFVQEALCLEEEHANTNAA